MRSFWQSISDQFTNLPQSNVDLQGRTVLITGGNAGLGFAAAQKFLSMHPAKLILGVRSVAKGQEAAKRLMDQFPGTDKDTIQVWEVDLTNLQSVCAFVTKAEKELTRLDIAIMNAGIIPRPWSVTSDGYETVLQVNAISTGLLGILLLPLLKQASENPIPGTPTFEPSLQFVTSEALYLAKFPEHTSPKPLAALNDKTTFLEEDRYNVTKLLELFLARRVAAVPAASGVKVCTVAPGLCKTDIFTEMKGGQKVFMAILTALTGRNAEMGVRNYTWAAFQSYPSGSLINSCRVDPPSDLANSQAGLEAERRIWEELSEIWKRVAPNVAEVLGA